VIRVDPKEIIFRTGTRSSEWRVVVQIVAFGRCGVRTRAIVCGVGEGVYSA